MLVLASAMQFAFGTEALRTFSGGTVVVVGGIAAFIGVIAVAGPAVKLTVRSPMAVVVPFVLGALALVAAPALVMFHRYSDAPSGSEVLFLTTAVWGGVLAVLTTRRWRDAPPRLAIAVLGLSGAAAVVANWERPSSFSPFVRHTTEQVWMVVAGVLWAVLWVRMARDRDAQESTRFAVSAAAGALVGAVVLALGQRVGVSELAHAASSPGMWAFGLSVAAVSAATVTLVRTAGAEAVAGAYFLPASALTAVTFVEQATTPLGPQPVQVAPALAGSVVALAACVFAWPRPERANGPALHPVHSATVVSVLGVVAALVGMALPALEANVAGMRSSGAHFAASYVMRGYEVAGTWLALGLALCVLAQSMSGWRLQPGRAVALVAAFLAWPLVWSTPLHTLTRFIPYEVQVDLGSEFASISFDTLPIPATLVAVAGAAAGLALLLLRQNRPAETGTGSRGDIS
ncbi:MAG: hypothetical protein ABFC80_03225 [Coriobacteriales bacterium]|nr:hypothetical protein [Actinomycetes bacterium]